MKYYNNQPIRIMEVDENGKETIRDLYDIEAKEDPEGNIEVTGSYIPEYEELYESNFRMAVIMDKQKHIIDKAIEYINEHKHLSMFADCREPEEDWIYDLEITANELLDILKGSDTNV